MQTDLWQAMLRKSPLLPVPFRDSPNAVQDFTDQGVDFHAGDIHMTLQGKVLRSGEAVWRLTSYGETYTTPFAARADDALA